MPGHVGLRPLAERGVAVRLHQGLQGLAGGVAIESPEVVERVAREEGVTMIDLYSAFDAPEPRREFTDSAHMNPAGARRMARLVAEVVEANERRESE